MKPFALDTKLSDGRWMISGNGMYFVTEADRGERLIEELNACWEITVELGHTMRRLQP